MMADEAEPEVKLPPEADPQAPCWAFIGPDEQGNFFIHWKGYSSERVQGLPLGSIDKIIRKVTENGALADHLT
jgi:hypothetical protein